MPLSEKEILEVLDLFQKSGWEDLTLESGGVRLSISKNGRAQNFSPRSPDELRGARSVIEEKPRTSSGLREAPSHSAPTPTPTIDPRWIAVKAPMLGTFYSAPKPGAPPFVAVGQQVTADDNVCILEVMKLMNYVKAGAAGKVAQIAVVNGALVEFDQVMIYIDPANG
ncbi:biotin carboxyl carrier protein [Panacagrimonas perspica]|uniref:Biotin carboxyl carrier protein of acetyl-CoA carboxylase n=1 Tax=Panacagrimonas perspica TaxID=381431 RepID=A0A4S3K6A5_9GAMM|nr:acetyl-CoA carboxylase biotin carboxyl carrier protein [Panacagrimonas perspica]TDU26925.1 biotin carboxyl carrier protein [Panacagrimonas perspica]THD03692.1 acetyl-CoA carboxylase, biotin carboxyl carrier protein [Panacagrimonas perspica]